MSERGYVKGFDPVIHKNSEPLCSLWLEDYLEINNYRANWLSEWQNYVEQSGNLKHDETRKLLIAEKLIER